MKKYCCIIVYCLLFPVIINANEPITKSKNEWYKPDYMKTQFAGNIGFMSVGLGYVWWRDIAQIDFLYGYLPESQGNATVHTFTLKNTFKLYDFTVLNKYNLSPILGFSISFEPGQNSYMNVPSRYPEGYYVSTSYYACLNIGLKSHFKFSDDSRFSAMEVFVEANTVADYAYFRITSHENEGTQIFTMALGVNMFF